MTEPVAGLQATPSGTLIERALAFLGGAPADSATVTAEVLGIARAPAVVSERLATALLAPHPGIRRLPDGRWDLVRHAGQSPLLAQTTFAVVDVETTGSRAARADRITEIAVVLVHGGEWSVALDTLVDPERAIPAAVTRVTRITNEDVRGKPVFGEIADEVIAALAGRVFVAHNSRFDWGFIANGVRRAKDVVLEGPQLCTVRLARRLIPGLKSRSLDSVARYFGIDIEQRHRAGGDAVATAKILLQLLERAETEGARTLRDLQALCARRTRPRKRRRRASPSSLEEM